MMAGHKCRHNAPSPPLNLRGGKSELFILHPSSFILQRGFTLLEILVSLALLSIILGALYSTFFLSHKAVSGVEDSILKLQECRMTLDKMTRELDSAIYNKDQNYTSFRIEDRDLYGKQTSKLTFTTFSPLTPGLSLISYYVEEKDGIMVLFKKIRSAYKAETEEDKGVELIEGVEAFSVEAKEKGKWIKTWDSSETNMRPEEIRLTITVLMKDRPLTIYETIQPKIGKTL
jgi:prepilin-type N-terminal cleavage/methylation domain-containing protein